MLVRDIEILIEGPVKKKKPIKPKKLKARPRKVLWYAHAGLWQNDLQHTRPDHQFYSEDEENNVYALDPEQTQCYGAWYPSRQMGVTFHTPRLRHVVVNPRAKISAFKG